MTERTSTAILLDGEASTSDLQSVCRQIALNAELSRELDDLSSEAAANTWNNLLSIATHGLEDGADPEDRDQARAKSALRCAVNAANRSHRFCQALPPTALVAFLVLLRQPDLHVELAALLTAVALHLTRVAGLKNEFGRLVGEIATLWETSDSSDVKSWLSAFFSRLLESNESFLFESFLDFDVPHFSSLLSVVETLVDSAAHGQHLKMTANNMQACVDILDRYLFDLGEDKSTRENALADIITLAQIIGNCALERTEYSRQLLEKTAAMQACCDILEATTDAEAAWIGRQPEVARATDRPAAEKPARRPKCQSDARLAKLSALLLEDGETRGRMRCAVVQAIGNIAAGSKDSAAFAGGQDAVILVLAAARRLPHDNPLITQWCITALRHLCLGVPSNQQRLLDIPDKPCGVIDRGRLLASLGLSVSTDRETGFVAVREED